MVKDAAYESRILTGTDTETPWGPGDLPSRVSDALDVIHEYMEPESVILVVGPSHLQYRRKPTIINWTGR